MKKHFYVFRHGQTENNARNIWQGARLNPPLDATGEKQAAELADRLATLGLEIIYSSQLERAVQTAKIANERLKLPLVIDTGFREVNFGEAEGLTYDEVEARFGELKQKVAIPKPETWHSRFPGLGSESKFEVYTRVKGEIYRIARTTNHQKIGISSHAGVLSSLLAGVNAHGIEVPNCCIAHFLYEEKYPARTLKFVEML